jgi:hypothetical protein
MSVQVIESGHNMETYRDAAVKRIKQLMIDWATNSLALAAELAQLAETFPFDPRKPTKPERPGFAKWAHQATGLSKTQIRNLLLIHKKFGEHARVDGKLGVHVMGLLARNNVPASARQEAIDRAAKGERLTTRDAKKIAKAHKLPGPKAANQQAKEEGRPILASDGYIYFGATPEQAKAGEDRRAMVFGVRRALDHLGNIELTGRQFLAYAAPHMLWKPEEAAIIKKALRWLKDLDDAWSNRQ